MEECKCNFSQHVSGDGCEVCRNKKGENILHFPDILSKNEHGFVDENGVKWNEYFAIYGFEGKTFSVPFWAVSLKDADDRLDALCSSGYIAGYVTEEDV